MYLDKQMSSRKLHINIKRPGLYTFAPESATGKTYLASMLSGINNVYVVTYNKVPAVLQATIHEALSGKYELVMLDRCDLYMTQELYNELLELSQNTIVVLDLKNFDKFCSIVPRPAQVILEDEVISLI